MLEDLEKGVITTSSPKPAKDGLLRVLEDRNEKVIPFSAWKKIDEEEKRLGSSRNKPRDKLTTREELMKAASE